MSAPVHIPEVAWREAGLERYGADVMSWRFRCPSCGHVATPADWKLAGAPEGTVAFSCVGRWLPGSREAFAGKGAPCNYAGGGLFRLNPVVVVSLGDVEHAMFDFADRPLSAPAPAAAEVGAP